jgi:hypothetical protein
MKRNIGLIAGGILLVAMLGGAAYMGARLLSQKAPSAADKGMMLNPAGPGGKGPVSVRVQRKPASELPQTPADVTGVFDHAADRSVFVKTVSGAVQIMSKNGQIATNADGPTVEIVVNQDTKIYQDATPMPSASTSVQEVQETVAEGSLDEIGQNSMIRAWGKRTGDRIVATVVVYTVPTIGKS